MLNLLKTTTKRTVKRTIVKASRELSERNWSQKRKALMKRSESNRHLPSVQEQSKTKKSVAKSKNDKGETIRLARY